MEKISGIVCGQGRERLLQFGAEQCLPILVVRSQRVKIRIPQMELYGGILRRDVDLGVTDGLPARSSHGGYDLKSVRAAAEAHGGTLTLHWENEWFTVRILLPQK